MEETLGEERAAEEASAEAPRPSRRLWFIVAGAVLVVVAGAVLLLTRSGGEGCGGGGRVLDEIEYDSAEVETTSADGKATKLCVLIADTEDRRAHGLMGVTDLGEYDGMVFVYTSDTGGPFWMKDTVMPLSIAWFKADGSFVSASDMEPCERNDMLCPLYAPTGPYRYALEVPKGGLARLGIAAGARLDLKSAIPS